MVLEAFALYKEGVAFKLSDIDVVMVNGYGFPSMRGGPIYWAAHQTDEKITSLIDVVNCNSDQMQVVASAIDEFRKVHDISKNE